MRRSQGGVSLIGRLFPTDGHQHGQYGPDGLTALSRDRITDRTKAPLAGGLVTGRSAAKVRLLRVMIDIH